MEHLGSQMVTAHATWPHGQFHLATFVACLTPLSPHFKSASSLSLSNKGKKKQITISVHTRLMSDHFVAQLLREI